MTTSSPAQTKRRPRAIRSGKALQIRLSVQEREALEAKAALANLSLTEFDYAHIGQAAIVNRRDWPRAAFYVGSP